MKTFVWFGVSPHVNYGASVLVASGHDVAHAKLQAYSENARFYDGSCRCDMEAYTAALGEPDLILNEHCHAIWMDFQE